jgi:HlyD family secretion protein
METATQNVQSANAQVALAQARLDELSAPDAHRIAAAQATLNAAVARYDAAVARHEALSLGASDAEIAAAQADLAQAQAALESLLSGPSETDVAIYETRVAQAETALQQARNTLADAILVAPFDGVITGVHVNQGERATGLAVTLVDRADLEIILSVDQVDLGHLEIGQPAVVTLETWPDQEIAGQITAIAPRATDNESGVAAYEVHLSLEGTNLPVRVGMTANADLITATREGVLLVPNAALTADREAGTYTVNRVHTDAQGKRTVSTVPVTIGLQNDQYTQIIDGLSKGDQVLLGQLDVQTGQAIRPGQRLLGNATGEAE